MAGSEGPCSAGCVRMSPSPLLQPTITEQNPASPPARSKTKGKKWEYTQVRGKKETKQTNPALITVDKILLLQTYQSPFPQLRLTKRQHWKGEGKNPNPTPQTETKQQTQAPGMQFIGRSPSPLQPGSGRSGGEEGPSRHWREVVPHAPARRKGRLPAAPPGIWAALPRPPAPSASQPLPARSLLTHTRLCPRSSDSSVLQEQPPANPAARHRRSSGEPCPEMRQPGKASRQVSAQPTPTHCSWQEQLASRSRKQG